MKFSCSTRAFIPSISLFIHMTKWSIINKVWNDQSTHSKLIGTPLLDSGSILRTTAICQATPVGPPSHPFALMWQQPVSFQFCCCGTALWSPLLHQAQAWCSVHLPAHTTGHFCVTGSRQCGWQTRHNLQQYSCMNGHCACLKGKCIQHAPQCPPCKMQATTKPLIHVAVAKILRVAQNPSILTLWIWSNDVLMVWMAMLRHAFAPGTKQLLDAILHGRLLQTYKTIDAACAEPDETSNWKSTFNLLISHPCPGDKKWWQKKLLDSAVGTDHSQKPI